MNDVDDVGDGRMARPVKSCASCGVVRPVDDRGECLAECTRLEIARRWSEDGKECVRLVRCPACLSELSPTEVPYHFAAPAHKPEDFGLGVDSETDTSPPKILADGGVFQDGGIEPGPCKMCGEELDHHQDEAAVSRWVKDRRGPDHWTQVDYYRCPNCRAGGEIVSAIDREYEVNRRGPAVCDRSARSLERCLEREFGSAPRSEDRDGESTTADTIALAAGGDPT